MEGESRTPEEEKRMDTRKGLVKASLEGPALLEVDHLSGFDHNLRAGFGIAGFTLRAGADTEHSEVPEFHGVAGFPSAQRGRSVKPKDPSGGTKSLPARLPSPQESS